jgi:hypothetical protein
VSEPLRADNPQGYQPIAGNDNQGPSLDNYKRLFQEAQWLTATNRQRSLLYSRYYHGKQLDKETERRLKGRKEPTFTINRVRPGVEGMVGVVDKGQTDPRAYPRNTPDENASEVATDCLRYVADSNRWKPAKLKTFRNILVEGTAAVIVEVDSKLDVKIRRVRWEEFFYDPYSREEDFSDASYMGIAKWQYVDAVAAAYPEFASQLQTVVSHGDGFGLSWEDRPYGNSTTWTDPRRKRLLTVEMYHLYGGQWLKCVFVGALKLEEGPSPYQDNEGNPCNPIEAQSAFVDDENNRYGAVEDMMGPQDEINTYRRKAAWLATFRQLQETDPSAAGIDPDEARREAARPDGVIPAGWNVVDNTGKFSMDVQLLAEAKSEIERTQPNPAMVGRGQATSGRQDLIRQQVGLTEISHLFAGLEDLERRVFKQVWARIRQFWTEPKMIRVTDTEGAMQFIQINEPVWGPPAPVIDQNTGQPQFDPITRQIVMQPQLMGYKNSVAQIDVDIIIDSTPDTANVQQEQFSMLVDLARTGALGPNPGPMLLQASSLPHKREIMDQVKQQQQQPPSPQEQLAMQAGQAKVELTQAQAQDWKARAARNMKEAMEPPEQPQQPQGPQPMDPVQFRKEQANTEKLFAQADEARARAAHLLSQTHRRIVEGPADVPFDVRSGQDF